MDIIVLKIVAMVFVGWFFFHEAKEMYNQDMPIHLQSFWVVLFVVVEAILFFARGV